MVYGVCWELVMVQFNMLMDLVNKFFVDSSRFMIWWDKIRLFFYGRLIMYVKQMSWFYYVFFDLYNIMEFMDWFWIDFILDWINGNIYNIKLWEKNLMVIYKI